MEVRILTTLPLIKYEDSEDESNAKKITVTEENECKKVDFVEVTESFLIKVADPFFSEIVEFEKDEKKIVTINLRKWIQPYVDLRFKISPSKFFENFVNLYYEPLMKCTDAETAFEVLE